MICPLCAGTRHEHYHEDRRGAYHRCDDCALVFLDPARWPLRNAELARYRLHRNAGDDARYLGFLSRLAEPVVARVPLGARGLDYGSGESDALARLLTAAGRPTVAYDPAFRDDASLLERRYDFVVCCEVLEHVHAPGDFLARLAGLTRPGGTIGIMTSLYDAAPSFADWWYLRDSTHVCFYGVDTMRWIADQFGWEMEVEMPNVVIFETGRADASRSTI